MLWKTTRCLLGRKFGTINVVTPKGIIIPKVIDPSQSMKILYKWFLCMRAELSWRPMFWLLGIQPILPMIHWTLILHNKGEN